MFKGRQVMCLLLEILKRSKRIFVCSVEDRVKQMELRIMALVEESCMLSSRPDSDDDSSAAKKEYDLGQVLWLIHLYCLFVLSNPIYAPSLHY